MGKQPRDSRGARPANAKKLLRVAGLPAVAALFARSAERVERLYFDQRTRPLVGALCAELARVHKPFRMVDADELARVAGTVMHGGVVALAEPRPERVFDPAQAAAWAQDGRPLVLCDAIGNPHNLGAIARSAAFFGLPRLVLSDHPAQAGLSDASYRVAEGGFEFLDVYRAEKFAAALKRLRRGYCVVGAAAEGGRPLDGLRRTERPFALVLGNEEHGLPRATLAACEELVTIPGAGFVQSLNVAATAAILIHALSAR